MRAKRMQSPRECIFTRQDETKMGALSNPFDPDEILWTGCPCGMHATMYEHQLAMSPVADGFAVLFLRDHRRTDR